MTEAKSPTEAFGIAIMREAAAESAVLLKNENKTLPYDKSRVISVFGVCQIQYYFTGYGSGGTVFSPRCVSPIEGIRASGGLTVNKRLAAAYEKWCDAHPAESGKWGAWKNARDEMPVGEKMAEEAAAESTDALVFIGRSAGEGGDIALKKGGYYLTDGEEKLLSIVTRAFDRVCVVINSGNITDMSWVEKYKISALLMAWQGGMESGNAVADILSGRINPNGRLADTIAGKWEDYPSSSNFGGKDYNNYAEDIYVGYRYFSAFAPEKVLYPFGFGLSYTTFTVAAEDFIHDGGGVKVRITVKNTGNYPGKETVLLFVSAPRGRLGGPAVKLAAFGKTEVIAPGERAEMILTCSDYMTSSFDDTGKTGHKNTYILEKGEYTFYANGVKSGAFTLDEDKVLLSAEDALPVKNPFWRIVPDGKNGFSKEPVPRGDFSLKEKILASLPKEITFGGNKGYKLSDVKAGKIDLDTFISQLDDGELESLASGEGKMDSPTAAKGNAGVFGGFTKSLGGKGVPIIVTSDGPSGVRLQTPASQLPCEAALACTWNTNLVEEVYKICGAELKSGGGDVLLGPGMNIRRNPLCGRNFEYFSEDPLLTGLMGAACVRGLRSAGVSACPKHFACNNQEFNRRKHDSRVSARALREVYLHGFEICVRLTNPDYIMTSYNQINGVWSCYNYGLALCVLREEWGFTGCVLTDWWMEKASSPVFPNLYDNAYRVRARVNVGMPGGFTRRDKSFSDNGSIKKCLKKGALTRAELQKNAGDVLRAAMKKL